MERDNGRPVSTTVTLLESSNEGEEKKGRWIKVLDEEEAKAQLLFSVPMIVTSLSYYAITVISVMFAGHLGELELAGSTLANSWATVTGFALMTGLSGALETLCGQGYGAKLYRMLGIYLQSSIITAFVFSVVVAIIWFFSEPILILLHQDPHIAKMAALYLKYSIPGIFAYGFIQCTLRFLQTQSAIIPLVLCSVVPMVIHVGITYAFVHLIPLGYKGAPLAASLSLWMSFLMLASYVNYAKRFKNTWEGLSMESFHHVIPNLKLAISSAVMVCLEYWAFEILVLLAGLLPNSKQSTSLTAMCVNTESITYMITYGFSATVSTRVSNELGAGNPFFKSHILGCPTIVSMDPELNRFILLNEGKGLVPGYPQSMLDILGKCNIAAVHGSTHKYMRGALLALVSPTMIRDQLLPKIDEFMRSHLSNWDGKIINIQEKTKQMAFLSSLKQIAGLESGSVSDSMESEFYKLVLGALSLPIDLPGTNYRRGFQARKTITSILTQIVEDRRASPKSQQDMLDCLLRTEDSRYRLTDEEIIDQIITMLYSGYETVSTTSMMAVKYLHDHPKALQKLREEHMAIRKRKGAEEPLDWNDYKSMSFTRAVILETSRLATIVNGVLRKTTQDMELNGFVIPKGWRIYIYTREINYDPVMYPEPLTFNPWRWLDKRLESHNYFLLFGGGTRLCPGKELGIAEISTFLHYFLIRYRWEEVGGDKLLKFPRVEAPNGLHIRVSSY